jgi:hypothetical protein
MLEKSEQVKENTMGILRTRTSLESDDYAREQDKRRSELIEQIKNGAFEKH